MNALDKLRQTAMGAVIISDWLGHEGIIAERPLAEARANICIGCPENVAPKWWEKATDGIALAMRAMLAVKNSCECHVENEEQLHVCKICGCCNRLSVWTPIEHIKSHMSVEQLNELPNKCWKKSEISGH